MTQAYQYVFATSVPLEEIESTLQLAALAVQSIHGEVQTLLDLAHSFDQARRALLIDAGTASGRDLNRVFAGFLHREFGQQNFTIERVTHLGTEPALVS
jgi:hypothetical protein